MVEQTWQIDDAEIKFVTKLCKLLGFIFWRVLKSDITISKIDIKKFCFWGLWGILWAVQIFLLRASNEKWNPRVLFLSQMNSDRRPPCMLLTFISISEITFSERDDTQSIAPLWYPHKPSHKDQYSDANHCINNSGKTIYKSVLSTSLGLVPHSHYVFSLPLINFQQQYI